MKCILCGWTKKGPSQFFMCDDCRKFSQIVNMVWSDVNKKFENLDTIDPTVDPIFRLLSDSVFITSHNPQVSIFYKMCTIFVESVLKSITTITEEELNRKLRSTRPLTDALKVFEELGLITVKLDKYQRIIVINEKVKKIARSIQIDTLDEQVTKRISQIFAGYVMLYLLRKMASVRNIEEVYELPYKQRFRTLWTILMFLWSKAFEGDDNFQEIELTKFLGRRRISTASVIHSLINIDPRKLTGMLKDVQIRNDDRVFYFADYILREMERIREVERERMGTRG